MTTRVHTDASGVVLTHTSTRSEGDFAVGAEPRALGERRRAIADHPWVWLRQVHGAEVVVATRDNAAEVAGSEADAVVTADAEVVLSIQTADCLPVVLWSPSGVIGAAHAGWRGLEAGVLEATWAAMTALGADDIQLHVGPGIGVECYEFGAEDLDRLAARFGDRVRGVTLAGAPALDLREAARVVTDGLAGRRPPPARGRPAPGPSPTCTACDAERWFSHRARAESGRMATVIWREPSHERATGAA